MYGEILDFNFYSKFVVKTLPLCLSDMVMLVEFEQIV